MLLYGYIIFCEKQHVVLTMKEKYHDRCRPKPVAEESEVYSR